MQRYLHPKEEANHQPLAVKWSDKYQAKLTPNVKWKREGPELDPPQVSFVWTFLMRREMVWINLR